MTDPESIRGLARWIDEGRAAALKRDLGRGEGRDLGVLLGTAYPSLTPVHGWQVDALGRLFDDGWRVHHRRVRLMGAIEEGAGSFDDGEGFAVRLRRRVWAERARIALRELLPTSLGGADIDTTARELSDLAEAALGVAFSEARARVRSRYGVPRRSDGLESTQFVLGMGKLGGRELNAGSDVDLIVLYDTDEGGSSLSLHEHFTHVTRRAVATVETATEDGFIWRVDLRLRPEGSRGPLVYSFAAAERYYETWGRLWERAALLRARAVAGDRKLGDSFRSEVIIPFVFRRDADPSIATALAGLVQRARLELSADAVRDLKLGRGGIREAEFFVQALQLIWGGRDASLRVRGTLRALSRLGSRGLVSDKEQRRITAAYVLLRRVEHAVQWSTGVQTHLVPKEPEALLRLSRALGYRSEVEFAEAVRDAREAVAEHFDSLLVEAPHPPSRHGALLSKLSGDDTEETIAVVFGNADVTDHLVTLARRPDGLLGNKTREAFPGLADRVIDAIAESADPEQAARYLRSIYGRFFSSTPYVAPLARDPRAITRLITVLASSVFVGDSILARPDLADLILFGSVEVTDEGIAAVIAEEIEAYRRETRDESEQVEQREAYIGALRRAKTKVMVEVAVADLAEEIDTREVTRLLSALAEQVLERAVQFELGGPGLAVIAVGKLGGFDIGYGSDLDVLFIYDPEKAPSGEDAAEYFARRAQRIIGLISSPHVAGPGYELDTRLRPSGSHGLLVTSLDAFARYHRVARSSTQPESERPAVFSSGAAWERQALLRARFVAGDRALGEETIRVASVAAYERGAPSVAEMHHLRMRMERELGRERATRYDLKTGRGGLLDIEFAIQWLQMRHGRDPRVRTTDTLEAVSALREAGHLDESSAETFREAYIFLRRLDQRIRVVRGTGTSVIDATLPGLDKLARRLGIARRPYASEADVLLQTYRETTEAVRETYRTVLGVDTARG